MARRKPFSVASFQRKRRYQPKRYQQARGWKSPALVLSGAAFVGVLIGIAPAMLPEASPFPNVYEEPLSGCTVTDGDTIRCGSERIRLLAIDTPELPGHCRKGRDCAPGDPYAATASLGLALTGKLTIDRVGQDHYGRTLARVAGAKGDLSCWQLERGHAIYKPKWDDGMRVARTCPSSIL